MTMAPINFHLFRMVQTAKYLMGVYTYAICENICGEVEDQEDDVMTLVRGRTVVRENETGRPVFYSFKNVG